MCVCERVCLCVLEGLGFFMGFYSIIELLNDISFFFSHFAHCSILIRKETVHSFYTSKMGFQNRGLHFILDFNISNEVLRSCRNVLLGS